MEKAFIYNKVKRMTRLGLCLLVLLPVQAAAEEYYGTYGIGISYDHESWHENYYKQEGIVRTVAGFEGSGTQQAPYLIKSVWDLCRLEDLVNAGNSFVNQYFRLEQDLDLGSGQANVDPYLWYPIGIHNGVAFKGNFDGNRHTIRNMRILTGDRNNENNQYAYGLFGYSGGVIRNLKMTDASIILKQDGQYNVARFFYAGLLCGYLYFYPDDNSYGAIYGCEVQGSVDGWFSNKSGSDSYSFMGGLVGMAVNPVSIYQCHAELTTTTGINGIAAMGGIVGAIIAGDDGFPTESDTDNSLAKPRQSYVFDCTACLTGNTGGRCVGGICGRNDYGNIVACAATGEINFGYSSLAATAGGIVGVNCHTVMDCVSMVTLHGSTDSTLGGIIGNNGGARSGNSIETSEDCNVFNCVYSAHLDGDRSPTAYGLLGAGKTFTNALFLGTMVKNENCPSANPIWNSSDEGNAYSDANLFDGGGNYSAYTSYPVLISGQSSETEFSSKANYHRWWTNNRNGDNTEITINDVWQFKQGFYPRLQVGSSNMTNGTTDALLKLHDYIIERAANKYGDDKAALTTPKLFPQYAWLASVPAFTHNGQWAYFMDTALSLAQRDMTDDQGNVLRADFSLEDYYNTRYSSLMTVAGNTATPKENTSGDVWLTISTPSGVSKKLLLNVNGNRKWDGELAANFDGGDGTSGSPYLIHDARQLILAFSVNKKDQYYKLVNDIWVNENLLTNTGEPSDGCSQWDHESHRDQNNWKAHLDGDGHLIRGLFSTNAFGLVEAMQEGASIENTGFVDCLVWSPASEANGEGTTDRPLAFLTPSVATGVKIRNCLFDGVLYERRLLGLFNMGGLLHNAARQNTPYVEDCVIAITSQVKDHFFSPPQALFVASSDGPGEFSNFAERVLVLNNTLAFQRMVPDGASMTDCYYPQGYLETSKWQPDDPDGKEVKDMTNGTFFSGDGFDKWTVKKGRFPMLTTFAETAYGKLISLPVYTDKQNRFDNMNYLLDFTPGTATWQTTDNSVLEYDTDIRVLEPKTASKSVYLVRSLDEAKVITPITTDASITAGIKFEDKEAKAFCVAHYDDDGNGEVSLSELKNVLLDEFQEDMNENDGNPNDNDGDQITMFPEFRYFSGITDLGTSFQNKEKLKTLDFSGKITELSDDDFKGNSSMSEFTIPNSVVSVSGTAFYNSGLENYEVESDHTMFTAIDGVLFNKEKDQLLSYPHGRKGTSITIPDNVKSIAKNAIYKMTGVDTLIIDAADYDYETVVKLAENAITTADGKELLVLIEDGTQELSPDELEARAFSPRRAGAVDHRGKGALLSKYQESEFWTSKNLDSFIYLNISEKSKDSDGNYWATLYCGFDTELPGFMTPYIVDKEKTSDNSETLVLRRISNQVHMLTPVVIKSTKPVTKYMLTPSKASTPFNIIPMYENLLDGVGRNGLNVNQSDANDGGCLTLGVNKSGKVGFFIYKGKEKIPCYRAYISVNKVSEARDFQLTVDDETTGVDAVKGMKTDGEYYNLKGQRVAHPSKGVYIHNGRKVIKR